MEYMPYVYRALITFLALVIVLGLQFQISSLRRRVDKLGHAAKEIKES